MRLPRLLRRFDRRRLSTEDSSKMFSRIAARGRPFSFVRLGDGEGALLGYRQGAETEEDMFSFRKHFGRDVVTAANLTAMQDLLVRAILDADVIGVRGDALTDPLASAGLDPDHGMMRLHALYVWWAGHRHQVTGVTTSANLAWDLALSRFWGPFLVERGRFGLINASPTLPDKLRAMLGVEVVHFRVPERHHHRSWWKDDMGSEPIFPDAFARVSRDLTSTDLRGLVVLVGAGVAGKAYCQIIRQNGGIALDVGAVLDAWDGRETRPSVLKSKSPMNPTTDAFLPVLAARH